MAGLTPEEQAFFESGGDVSKLGDNAEPGVQGVETVHINQPGSLEAAGLSDSGTPPAPTPQVSDPPVTPPVASPVPDPTEALRQLVANSNAQIAALTQRIEEMKGAPPAKVEPPAPDPNTDPLGSMLHQLDQVNRTVAELKGQIADRQQQDQQQAAFNEFQRQVTNLRDEFVKQQADFPAAYEHLRAARAADLRAFGLSEADINKQIFQEEFALSQRSIAAAKNPAAEIYDMAKRHGYQAKPPVAAPPPAQKFETLKKGVESAPPTLPQTHVAEDISVESLRDASDADLNKVVTDSALWAKIAGTDRHPI